MPPNIIPDDKQAQPAGLSWHKTKLFTLAALVGTMVPCMAFAEESAVAATATINSGDTAWMLTSTALVLMMTIPGLALFYGGLVRKGNVLTTMAQSFATTCLISVLWVIVGYSLSFGDGNDYIGDFSRFMVKNVALEKPFTLGSTAGAQVAMTIPETVYMMFQMTFAIITPALIAGAFAERMKFSAVLWFMGLWSLLVYAPVAHWVWHPNGFLFKLGVLDYAGGTVVHINAGIAGLVTALVIGKRVGFPKTISTPHNLVFSLVGACLLWVGWFGFNAGSAVAAGGRAGMAMSVTMVASGAAGLAWMFVGWFVHKKPSIVGMISGAVAGLVAITPASGYVDISGALIIGFVTGIICYFACTTIKAKLGYDDSLDCVGVHGAGGLVGALLTGVFATKAIGGDAASGLIDGNAHQVVVQLIGIGATALWCAFVTYIIIKAISLTVGLRVDEAIESAGLDAHMHGETLE
jgi:Amt family ammonium transporter